MTDARVHVHTTRLAIRWGDMDVLGHVNNTVYFRYMEQARLEWFYALAEGSAYTSGSGPVIANASCNFSRPLVYPATVDVAMYVCAPGRSSIPSFYDISVDGVRFAD